ncbi:hypothetical protein [Rhodococcoides fascians]|uniref:hypothetical protein n=1 Tax=Rhodococcoides fascians TaxID=1828 RepID=UPI00056979C0|nr:hypothetical protein [Rhodococcus fascians]
MTVRQFDRVEPLPRSAPECGAPTYNDERCGLPEDHDDDHAVISLSGLVIRTFPQRPRTYLFDEIPTIQA